MKLCGRIIPRTRIRVDMLSEGRREERETDVRDGVVVFEGMNRVLLSLNGIVEAI